MSIPGVVTFDLTISEDKTKEGALEILKVIRPKWKPDDIVFKTYTEGITNKLLGCRLTDDKVYDDSILIRVFGAKTELVIDRDIEKLSMYIYDKAGCGKPLYAQFNNGLAYGFINGNCLDEKSVRDEHIGRLIATEMVKVASIDPSVYGNGLPTVPMERLNTRKPMLFPKIRKYLAEAPTSFPEAKRTEILKRDIRSAEDLSAEIDLLERELSCLGSPIVLSHNDILLKNVVHNEQHDRCYFIDYEYTAFNYQAYDIGNHFCEWAGIDEVDYDLYPDKAEQMIWLRHYLTAWNTQQGAAHTTPTDLDMERLYVQVNKFALASHFFWGVWALIQARYSTIDFDYLDYARIRFGEYFRKKEEFLALQMPE